ncbi:hypothetical protein NDI76_16890 [Halogeometricum sp. S1BR25-6]|uniref:Right handed beta helix domain-containing protein n=1 Tax=Halogeometricum salsisoli TaxID=2950536 RepID=A0ABU2GJ33_9EURY|nr:hypothetical protein [Halogeometricum sp. S1BR25-6]MDS0300426.1 hypothetical protein [Halogeometricum sp. S1BR25-6]
MAERPAESRNKTGTATDRTDGGRLLGRRDALRLGAATAAVVAGAGAASTSAAAGIEREGVTFDRVVNAVDDLGMDSSGGERIDEKLGAALGDSGTLVEFPAGEYKITQRVRLENRTGIVGTAADRSKVRFVPSSGKSFQWVNFNNAAGVVLKDFTIDRLEEYDTSVGMGGNIKRDFHLSNVEYDGWTPSGPQMFAANVTDPEGVAVVDGLYRKGPTQFQRYPKSSLDIWSGRGHQGTLYLRNVEIHNGSESGIYTGKGDGNYIIEDGYFKNVVHTAIRTAGRDSAIRRCTVVMDTDDWDPRNEKVESTYNDGENVQLNRAIWAQTADRRFSGPVIEDCDVIIRNTEQALAGIYINSDTGGAVIKNTRVRVDDGRAIPIYAKNPTDEAGEPLAMELENVSVTGESWDKAAMYFEGRPNSVIRNCCISSPNNNDGILLNDCDGSVVENTNVSVGGRSTTFKNGSVTTSGITSGESCPLPSLPDSTPSGSEGSDGDGAEGSDGASDFDLPYRFRVESTGGGKTEFTLTTSGRMLPAADAEGVVENNTVADSVGPESGVDSYLYEGYVTDFSASGAEYANYYIETADGSRSTRVTPDLLSANTLVVKSTGGGKTRYVVGVDGEIVRGGAGLEDTTGTQTAAGVVGPTDGMDVFYYTGSITNLSVEGGEYATVKVNGTEIDAAKYEYGTDEEAPTDPATDLPNTLTVKGVGSSATYAVTVSEEIAVSPEETDDLSVATKSAEGAVTAQEDRYVYAGEITDFQLAGDATVLVNGTETDPADLGDNDDLPNTLVIDGERTAAPGTYKVYVTGAIEAAPDLSVASGEDSFDSLEDKVMDGAIVGVVGSGKDGYRFSGSVTRMEINGDAVVNFGR